jgi:hypothetical protein
MRKALTVLLISTLLGSNCKKSISELDKLPLVTQTGANTFGCLVNGGAFIPSGSDGNKPNFSILVDPTFQNGTFNIRAYQFVNGKYINISFSTNDIKSIGTYTISPAGTIFLDYDNEVNGCRFLYSHSNFSSGYLKITRYDLQQGIFSGEFEAKLFDQSSCDTLRLTNGIFDKKL